MHQIASLIHYPILSTRFCKKPWNIFQCLTNTSVYAWAAVTYEMLSKVCYSCAKWLLICCKDDNAYD